MRRLALLLLLGGAAQAADGRFDPRTAATPFFTDVKGATAMARLARKDYAGCAALLDGKSPQATFLGAYCQLKAGNFAVAATRFDELVSTYPLLADYARLFAAQALLATAKYDQAIVRAKAVSSSSPLAAEALYAVASALDRGGHPSEAADAYARYLAAYPNSWRTGETRGKLATALDAAGRTDEATIVWREVYLESPVSLGARAQARLDPSKPLSADEKARRANVLFDAMKNKDSELAWQEVLAAPSLTPQLACKARFFMAQSVMKQRDRARAAPLFEAAVGACETAKDEDLVAKSLYNAGRTNGSRAEKDAAAGEKAIALDAKIMSEHATHSYADDAALRRADLLDTLGRSDEATAALAEIPEKFPTGDQRGEALFRLAFRAFETGDFAKAASWLERELALLPREEGWWEAGRTLYWLGRARDAQSDHDGAKVAWTRAVREYPLSYYALLAVNRLPSEDAAKLLAELSWTPERPSLNVADRPLFHAEAFQRAIELLRLGLGPEARRELAAAGIDAPKRGNALPADRELGWVGAELNESAGDFAASHAYGRYVDLAYARTWPQGQNELYWDLSFPRAYATLVEENTAKTGQPAALELAIMREESAFDPNLESFANAVGLTQLTNAPATRFAEGLPHDAQALRDPATNIAIGARELGALYALFDHNAALAIAGYNAGEGAVKRWLRDPDNAGRQLDEFIERIPYDETRGYTKRVLGSYFTYAWLDRTTISPSARVPKITFALPKKR